MPSPAAVKRDFGLADTLDVSAITMVIVPDATRPVIDSLARVLDLHAAPVPKNGKASCTISLGCFQPPMFQFRWMNSAGVILPASKALSPYSTPTLSAGRPANPSCGRRPKTLTM